MREYERNLLTEVSASPVIGPVVSSERITSRNGLRNSFGANSVKSATKQHFDVFAAQHTSTPHRVLVEI